MIWTTHLADSSIVMGSCLHTDNMTQAWMSKSSMLENLILEACLVSSANFREGKRHKFIDAQKPRLGPLHNTGHGSSQQKSFEVFFLSNNLHLCCSRVT